MNTPEEKAKSIYNHIFDQIHKGRHYSDYQLSVTAAKQCAILCVEEIIKVLDGFSYTPTQDYWQKVKQALISM